MYEFLSYVAGDYMTRTPVTIAPSTTLAEAGEIFAARSFNGLPVTTEDGQLVGMLTKLDWLKAFVFSSETIVPHYEEIIGQRVDRFLSRDLVTIGPATPLTRVLQRMIDTRYKSIPVLEEGRLVGIIAREDIVRALESAATSAATKDVAGRGSRTSR